MNLRSWSKDHTLGLLLGIATTVVAVFLVVGFFAYQDGISYAESFQRFTFFRVMTAKVVSLASIPNLFWFHRYLKQQKWGRGQGIIMATVLNLIVILIYKFVL